MSQGWLAGWLGREASSWARVGWLAGWVGQQAREPGLVG